MVARQSSSRPCLKKRSDQFAVARSISVEVPVPLAPVPGQDGDLDPALSHGKRARLVHLLEPEAIDEADDAGSAREDGAPLLEGEIGGDDNRALLVPAADDVVEQVRRA